MLGRIALLLLIPMTFLGSVLAQDQPQARDLEPLNIVAMQIPWLLDEKKPGPYNKMVDELLLTYGDNVNVKILPLRRAMRHFFKGNADCFFVGDYDEAYFRGSYLSRESVTVSRPFNTASIRAFTRRGAEPVRSIEDLYDRRIAIDLGVGGSIRIKKLFPNLTNTVDSLNAGQAHAMLIKGRVEAVLMMDYDYELYATRHPERERLTASTNFEFERVDDALMCKKNQRTHALINHVNARITDMKQSGMLAALLRPHGRPITTQTANHSEDQDRLALK